MSSDSATGLLDDNTIFTHGPWQSSFTSISVAPAFLAARTTRLISDCVIRAGRLVMQRCLLSVDDGVLGDGRRFFCGAHCRSPLKREIFSPIGFGYPDAFFRFRRMCAALEGPLVAF